jgi:hypothetical protein
MTMEQYRKFITALQQTINSRDPGDMASVRATNEEILRLKDVQPSAVHNVTTLSNVSVQYANEMYIGEQLLPVASVQKSADKIAVYTFKDRVNYPDDEVGPRGDANEITDSRSFDSYVTLGYAFQNYVDAMTLADQDAPLNEMVDLVEAVAEGLLLKREIRCASTLCTSGNYGSNTGAIAAADRWNTATGGDPIGDIQHAMSHILNGRGPSKLMGFCSLDVYNVLSRHPAVLDLFKYNGSSPGLATPGMIAGFLGMDGLLVGKAYKDVTNETVAQTLTRVWSDVFGIVRVANRPSVRNACFGYTIRHGQLNTQQWFDGSKGVAGGYFAKIGVQECQKIIAAPTGYLITTPV